VAGAKQPPRLLVLDAYAPEGRAALRDAGATQAGHLYAQLLRRLSPGCEVDIAYPADSDDDVPAPSDFGSYAGAVWTGSSLTILDDERPSVRRQIDLARSLFDCGVASFGSCWAAQLAVVAAGGSCEANPKGREFGISRKIALSEFGRAHPLYRDKPTVFDAFTSHADHVATMPAQGAVLASNEFSPVQALSARRGKGSFWAVQYHPEYDLREVASLCRLRGDELVAQGMFADRRAVRDTIEGFEALHRDPSRSDLAKEFNVSADLLDEERRTLEVRNWLSEHID
jgi:GMP synthase (glutamine-hydrolysing)